MDWLAHAADAAKGKTLGDVKVLLAKADALRWVLDELGGE